MCSGVSSRWTWLVIMQCACSLQPVRRSIPTQVEEVARSSSPAKHAERLWRAGAWIATPGSMRRARRGIPCQRAGGPSR